MNQCATCAYSFIIIEKSTLLSMFSPHGDEILKEQEYDVYDCRRYPPSMEGWPKVLKDTWCGEYIENSP